MDRAAKVCSMNLVCVCGRLGVFCRGSGRGAGCCCMLVLVVIYRCVSHAIRLLCFVVVHTVSRLFCYKGATTTHTDCQLLVVVTVQAGGQIYKIKQTLLVGAE